ncbi:MAG: cobalamin B12-binding domain-containing protein [Candidatus Bipolaricaulota bacterium]
MSDELHLDTSGLPRVSSEAAAEYTEKADELTEKVNEDLKGREDIKSLIGDNPLQTMYENHENHVRFMANVFKLNDYDLLIRTVGWVYRTYKRHGFFYDYFPVELKAWSEAVKKELEPENAEEVNEIYSFMLENHREFINLAESERETGLEELDKDREVAESFLEALLAGNHGRSLEIARDNVHSPDDVRAFFKNVIRPAMYEVGKRWEMGKISVAEEHLASSIVSRVLAAIYSQVFDFEYTKGKAVITATANEFHEICSR